MRVERNTNQHSFNCWLSTEEYENLRRSTESYRDELVIRFGGEIGLRSFEVPQITPEDVRREVIEDKDYYFLRVSQGKDTTGSGGKPRDAYLPREVERDLHRYQRAENVAQSDPVIDVSPRTVQRIVKSAAARAADRTGDDDFRKVSAHDLRRYFAHSCLVRERMNPRIVMEIGGWDNYQALERYLNKPSTETIVSEFSRASMV